jgi:hypothetical protein
MQLKEQIQQHINKPNLYPTDIKQWGLTVFLKKLPVGRVIAIHSNPDKYSVEEGCKDLLTCVCDEQGNPVLTNETLENMDIDIFNFLLEELGNLAYPNKTEIDNELKN